MYVELVVPCPNCPWQQQSCVLIAETSVSQTQPVLLSEPIYVQRSLTYVFRFTCA
jgi:hypothetical protein